MGMFDNITVPKAYLRSLLTKKQEKLVDRNDFQTKSLNNSLCNYKVYKQKLFLKNPKKGWEKISYTGKITFYNLFREESAVSYWAAFAFTFADGKVDKKQLITFEAYDPKKQKLNDKIKAFHKTFKYRFFIKFLRFLTRIHNWAANKTVLPPSEKKQKKEKLSFWKHS